MMYLLNKRPNNTVLSLIFIAVGLFFLLCTSCENDKPKMKIEKPSNLLERKTFEAILWKFYLIEGDVRFQIRSANFDSLRTRTTAEMNELYRKNNTDHEQFMKSYAYYMNDPILSEEIMKNIVNQLVEIQAKEEAKEREKDSATRQKDSIIQIEKLIKNIIRIKHK